MTVNVEAVLKQARELGVSLTAEGEHILYRPKSVAPPDFVDALRQHKPVILRRLAARDRLLARLRAGVVWLTTSHDTLLVHEGQGDIASPRYVKLKDRFLSALAAWDCLDYMLRFVYEHQGCVMAEGRCPGDSPVTCRACAR